jgi:hypothetical protein
VGFPNEPFSGQPDFSHPKRSEIVWNRPFVRLFTIQLEQINSDARALARKDFVGK